MVYSLSPEASLEMLWYMRIGMSTASRESERVRGISEETCLLQELIYENIPVPMRMRRKAKRR